MQTVKAERITITLPSEMLASIKDKVHSGAYNSTSELVREAMRLWQKKEDEHKARLKAVCLYHLMMHSNLSSRTSVTMKRPKPLKKDRI